ncbi:hypothetical protein ACFOLK_03090 [Marinococcus halophilus]
MLYYAYNPLSTQPIQGVAGKKSKGVCAFGTKKEARDEHESEEAHYLAEQ